jgi:hypothetical protein
MEYKAAEFKEKAEESRKLGSGAQRSKARRLVKLQEQIAELTKTLGASGIDVEALLAAAREKEEAA